MGSKPFSAYAAIISDPKSKAQHVYRALGVIENVRVDRSQFVELAIQRLGDDSDLIRLSAARLLGEIGNSRDTPPIVVLLSDDRREVVCAAANALAAIGDKRTVAAMDVWLKSLHHSDDPEIRAHVAKCRDGLMKRLEKSEPLVNTSIPPPRPVVKP